MCVCIVYFALFYVASIDLFYVFFCAAIVESLPSTQYSTYDHCYLQRLISCCDLASAAAAIQKKNKP